MLRTAAAPWQVCTGSSERHDAKLCLRGHLSWLHQLHATRVFKKKTHTHLKLHLQMFWMPFYSYPTNSKSFPFAFIMTKVLHLHKAVLQLWPYGHYCSWSAMVCFHGNHRRSLQTHCLEGLQQPTCMCLGRRVGGRGGCRVHNQGDTKSHWG